jgi:hypothetical protein
MPLYRLLLDNQHFSHRTTRGPLSSQLSVSPNNVPSTTLRYRDNVDLTMARNRAGVPLYPKALFFFNHVYIFGDLCMGNLYITERMKILDTC